MVVAILGPGTTDYGLELMIPMTQPSQVGDVLQNIHRKVRITVMMTEVTCVWLK